MEILYSCLVDFQVWFAWSQCIFHSIPISVESLPVFPTDEPRLKDNEDYHKTSNGDVSFISLAKDLAYQQSLVFHLRVFYHDFSDFYHVNSFTAI